MFNEVFSNEGGLLSGSTRILVTHRRNVIGKADYIMVSEEVAKVLGGEKRDTT